MFSSKVKYCSYVFYLALLNIFNSTDAQRLQSASLIGGRATDTEDVAYLVSIQNEDKHICGGSIIGDKHILTAAHCLFNSKNEFIEKPMKIIAGTNDLNNEDSEVIGIIIEKIYVPENYNDSMWSISLPKDDIAVLKLKNSLGLRRRINLKKLQLPRANRKSKGKTFRTYENYEVIIAGFGWDRVKVKSHNKTEYEIGSSSDRLFSARAKVIVNSECQQYYADTIDDSKLCARIIEHDDGTPQGVCRGDSGSPLVYKSNTIIGVVSGIAVGCNENNQPGIYCRVSSYMNFIRNSLKDFTDGMNVKTFF